MSSKAIKIPCELFSLFVDVEETVLSSEPGNGLASSQPEAGLSYFGPGHFRPGPLLETPKPCAGGACGDG